MTIASTIRVRAVEPGYHADALRRIGDVFDFRVDNLRPAHAAPAGCARVTVNEVAYELPHWLELVSDDLPEAA